MLVNKKLHLLNYNELNLFSVDSNGEFDPTPSEEFLIFDGYKIYLKARHKSKNLRICIKWTNKDKKKSLDSAFDSARIASLADRQSMIKIEISHPIKAKPEDIMHFCQKNKEWIAKTYARYEAKLAKTDEIFQGNGGKILLFGEWIDEQNLALIAQDFFHKSNLAISPSLSQNPSSNLATKPPKLKTTKQMLSFVLLCYIKERAQALAKQMQLEYGKIAVRETFTRFGSCTQNRLSFSLLLACASKPQIDYVIIHELAHIVHKNHSYRFWNLVEKHCKEWRMLRKSLQEECPLFRLILERL